MVLDHCVEHVTAVNTPPRQCPKNIGLSHVEKAVPYHEPLASRASHIDLHFLPIEASNIRPRAGIDVDRNKPGTLGTSALPGVRSTVYQLTIASTA
jgi:hypothetical protein